MDQACLICKVVQIKFRKPQVNLYVENLTRSREFYEKIGFVVKFTANIGGMPVHHEMLLDNFILGIASKDSARSEHGLNPGENKGSELVLWTDDTDLSTEFLVKEGAKILSPSHDFLDGKLRVAWVQDPDGNPIQIVTEIGQT